MKIRIHRVHVFVFISLLLLFCYAAHAGAQDVSAQRSGSSWVLENVGDIPGKAAEAAAGDSFTVLNSFCVATDCTDGEDPYAGVIRDSAGNLYGTTLIGGAHACGTVFEWDATTGKNTVLYNFCSAPNYTDGDQPWAGLIQDTAGNLYGTTFQGGAQGAGTVFELKPPQETGGPWTETVLYSFCSAGGAGCTDGGIPKAGPIMDSAGNLYGTTEWGGAYNRFGGTVFRLQPPAQAGGVWTETVLYSFCSAANCADGAQPLAGVTMDESSGDLYGTTSASGANSGGNVFMLQPPAKTGGAWTQTVLYNFCSVGGLSCTDGGYPLGGVIRDATGNLYGTTSAGGTVGPSCTNGVSAGETCGVVFKLAPPKQSGNAWTETVLHTFCTTSACSDGFNPSAGLIQDAAGNLYGTTHGTPVQGGGGSVFQLVPPTQQGGAWTDTVLYSFCSLASCTDGRFPLAGVIQDSAGSLYGTTSRGGANDSGTVFRLVPSGGGGTATVTPTSSPNPSYVGEPVIFSAVVSGSGATPTGTVTFEEGTTSLGTATLSGGTASVSTTFTKSGKYSIVAEYSGDSNYKAANSSPLSQVVNAARKYSTTTTLTSSLNPSTYGQAVTLTATVTSAGPTPTGTVTFKNGSKSLGKATLSGDVAKFTTGALPVGTLSITASYGGDAANSKSTSSALKQVVDIATSKTVIVSSVNPSKTGQTVKFTATVTSATTAPTGTVTFKDGSTTLGTGAIAKATGKANYSTKTLSAGSHNITAVYDGTADVGGSTSTVLVQTVK